MPDIGEYRDRVTVLTRSVAAGDGFGQRVESWAAGASPDYWARIEAAAGSESVVTPKQSGQGLSLRFRGVATVTALDRVTVKATGETYAVTGAWRERSESGGWQTVASLAGLV